MRWCSLLLLLAVIVGSPAEAAVRRIFVDAGARTAALAKLLSDEGGVEISSEPSADVRVVLREAGSTWTLVVNDRAGRVVLRRDIGAAGGDLAALRVTALLVEQAVRGRRAEPEPPVVRTASVAAVRSSTMTRAELAAGGELGTVRALPAVPVAPTAASLIASASALPRAGTGTAAPGATATTTAAVTAGAAPAAREGRPSAPVVAEEADSPDGPRIAGLRRKRSVEATAEAARATPEVAGVPAAPTEAPVVDGAVADGAVADGAAAEETTADGAEPVLAVPLDAALDGPQPIISGAYVPEGWRLVASAAARWWQNPGAIPQVGFGLGAEAGVGGFLVGGTAKLAGLACCERTTTGLTADVYEVGGALYGLLPLARWSGDLLTLYGSAEVDATAMLGKAGLVIGGETNSPTDLLGFSATLGVGPALELRLNERLALRLRAALRVSMAVYEIDSGTILGDPLHTGWVHPYFDLSLPIRL